MQFLNATFGCHGSGMKQINLPGLTVLVIFDCDGVLVDSEVLAAKVFSQVLSDHGINFSAGQCLGALRGLTLEDCIRHIEQYCQTRLPNSFLAQLQHATQSAFAHELRPVAGIPETLRQLSQLPWAKLCVASNGGLAKTHHSLTVTGLLDFFAQNYYSAEQVERGKPAPDLFLLAAARCEVPPERCIVVEDSVVGVEAAVAAGMAVLYFNDREDGTLPDGVRVFSRMDRLLREITAFAVKPLGQSHPPPMPDHQTQ